MPITISLYKKAADEDWEQLISKEEEEENHMDEVQRDMLQEEYEEMGDQNPTERLKWLVDKQEDSSGDANYWVTNVIDFVQEEMVEEYHYAIKKEFGSEWEYYEQTNVDLHNYAWDIANKKLELIKKGLDVEDDTLLLLDAIRNIYIKHNKEVEQLKAEEAAEQKEYEEQRDTVRHMQTPEEAGRMERQFEPGELENIPSKQNLGTYSKIIHKLVSIANQLDQKGLYKEASVIDQIIKGKI